LEATEVVLLDGGKALGIDSAEVTLSGGESRGVSFSLPTEAGDAGDHTVRVISKDAEASVPVQITEQPEEANFEVAIDSTNAPVEAGEELEVTATVENTGDLEATQSIILDVPNVGPIGLDPSEQVTLSGGESRVVSFNQPTEAGAAGNHLVTVASENTGDSASIRITEQPEAANFDVAIDSINSPIEAGEELEVTATVENTGDLAATQSINFDVGDLASDSTSVSLDSGESTTTSVSLLTERGDTGEYTVTIGSKNATVQQEIKITSGQKSVSIERPDTVTVAPDGQVNVTADLDGEGSDLISYSETIEDGAPLSIVDGSSETGFAPVQVDDPSEQEDLFVLHFSPTERVQSDTVEFTIEADAAASPGDTFEISSELTTELASRTDTLTVEIADEKPSVETYRPAPGEPVDNSGVVQAILDWRNGEISNGLIVDVVVDWQTGQ
jgi:uncharacterized membrane protein